MDREGHIYTPDPTSLGTLTILALGVVIFFFPKERVCSWMTGQRPPTPLPSVPSSVST